MESCNAIVFARSTHVRKIARKLHARFKKLLLLGSINDVVRVVEKHQHDDEAKTIHLLIIDLDSQGLKLCEAIQTRPRSAHINGNRFIAVVVLVHSTDKDSQNFADQTLRLGAISVIWLPADLNSIQDVVLQSIRMRSMTEGIYKLVSTNKSTRPPQVQLEGLGDRAESSSDGDSDGGEALIVGDESEVGSEVDGGLLESARSDASPRSVRTMSTHRRSTPRLSEGSINRAKHGLEPPLSARERATDIIDARHRPYLTSTSKARRNSRNLVKQSIERKTLSLESFIRKDAPPIGPLRSVAGLPKELTTAVWADFNSKGQSKASKPPRASTAEPLRKRSQSLNWNTRSGNSAEITSTQRTSAVAAYFESMRQKLTIQFTVAIGVRQRQRQRFHELLDSMGALQVSLSPPVGRQNDKKQQQQQKALYSMSQNLVTDVLQHNVIAIDPNTRRTLLNEQFYLNRGWKAYSQGDFEGAENYWKRGLQRSFDQSQPSYLCCANLAVVAFHLKKFHQALEGFTATLEILRQREAPWLLEDEGITLFNRSITWFRLGDDTKGIADLKLAATVDSSASGTIQATLGLALRRTEKYVEAEGIYSQLAQLANKGGSKPNSPLWLQGASLLLQLPDDSDSDTDTSASTPVRSKRTGSNVDSEFEIELASPPRDRLPSTPQRDTSNKAGSEMSDTNSTPGVRTRSRTQSSIKKSHQRILLHKQTRATPKKFVEAVTIQSAMRDSLRSRVEQQDSIGTHDNYMDLGVYRTLHGLGADLYDRLFLRPTLLQEALCTPPGIRQHRQLEEICALLKTIPLTESLGDFEVWKLANEVEYRALRSKCSIVSQGHTLEYCGVVLSGEVTIKLQSNDGRSAVVAELSQYGSFGEYDLLYSGPVETWPSEESFHFSHTAHTARDQLPNCKKLTRDANIQSCFYSANVVQPTELLLVPYSSFHSSLRSTVLRRFWGRIQLLKGCGIFKEWCFDDIARLARLAFLRCYDDKRVILKQGDKPTSLFVVERGVCRVERAPHNTVRLGRDLQETIRQLEHLQTQYSYHHRLRGIAPPTPAQGNQGIHPYGQTTMTEVKQKELSTQIEAKRASLLELKQTQLDQICEVGTISRPQIFGEACILEPVDGVAPGTIVADGYCEVLSLHHLQVEFFEVNQTFIEQLQAHSFQYSDDTELAKLARRDKAWQHYKKTLTEGFAKRHQTG